jgi:NitT/TauT family transport system substrate-binding protein
MRARPAGLLLAALLAPGCGGAAPAAAPADGVAVVRIGHFPNVTHAHGLVAHALTRKGTGWFEERLGEGVRVEWLVYSAGPGAMEGILAGSLDFAYAGPAPIVNAHARSAGSEVRVLAGATRGGAALVVRKGAALSAPADFRGRRIGTPQFGNSQDVSCRAWLAAGGLRIRQTGGDALVLPAGNPDLLALLRRGELDAAWTVEPWVSRLEAEAGARVLVEEPEALTTVLAARAGFLAERPALAVRVLRAHRELTAWLGAHPAEAKALLREEFAAETRREFPADLADRCWGRMRFDDAVARADFEAFTAASARAGLIPGSPDLSRLVAEVP